MASPFLLPSAPPAVESPVEASSASPWRLAAVLRLLAARLAQAFANPVGSSSLRLPFSPVVMPALAAAFVPPVWPALPSTFAPEIAGPWVVDPSIAADPAWTGPFGLCYPADRSCPVSAAVVASTLPVSFSPARG